MKALCTNLPFNILFLSPSSYGGDTQGGKSRSPGRVFDSPASSCWWSWWKCFSFSMRRSTAVSSVPLTLITKQLWYFLPSHLVFFISQDFRLLARIDWSWSGMSYSSAHLGVEAVFSWSSVVKAALCIDGRGCPLSSTPFELPATWLPRWCSMKGCAGRNLVVVVTEPPILNNCNDLCFLFKWQVLLLSVDSKLLQSLSTTIWYKCFPQWETLSERKVV